MKLKDEGFSGLFKKGGLLDICLYKVIVFQIFALAT